MKNLQVNRGSSYSNWLYEEVFDPNQQVNLIYVHEEDDLVLQYCISPPSKYHFNEYFTTDKIN